MTRQPDLIALTDGRVVALGTADTWSVPLQLFDPATSAWTSLPQTLVPRIAATVAALPDGSLLLSGGRVPDGPGDCFAVSGSERYDPVTGSWVTDAPMRSARFLAQSVSLEDGSVLVMGGQHPIVPGECAAQDGFAGTDAGGGSEIYALPR